VRIKSLNVTHSHSLNVTHSHIALKEDLTKAALDMSPFEARLRQQTAELIKQRQSGGSVFQLFLLLLLHLQFGMYLHSL